MDFEEVYGTQLTCHISGEYKVGSKYSRISISSKSM